MANSIELITKYSTKAWDKVYKAEAISSLFDAPESQVQFTGAKTVKIAKFQASGLGNYYRNNEAGAYNPYPGTTQNMGTTAVPFGYAAASAGLVWEEFTLKCDRSARYQVEMFDNEETDGLAIGAATTEISRTIMVPEVDAYCFSQIAGAAANVGTFNKDDLNASVGGTAKNCVEALNEALLKFEEYEIPAEKQVILVSPKFMQGLRRESIELSRLLQGDYNKDVKFTMTKYEGRDLVVVPPARFRTNILLTESGYTWGTGSEDIAFMLVAKDVVLHVVKYNKVKVISGDMNLAGANFDGYSIFARIYHDVFVPDNKKYAIYVSTFVAGTTDTDAYVADQGSFKITLDQDTAHKISVLENNKPDVLVKKYATSNKDGGETVGTVATGTLTPVAIGSLLTTGQKVYAIGEGKIVLGEATGETYTS